MAVWQTSFQRILNKGLGLYRQTPFYLRKLFHGYEIQMYMREGWFPRNQDLHPVLGGSIHRQFYLGCMESKEKKMVSQSFNKKISCRPYAVVNAPVKFWCKQLWCESKYGVWSEDLKKAQPWTGVEIQERALRNFETLSYNQVMDTIGYCVKFHGYICHELLRVFLDSVNSNFQKDSTVWDPKSVSRLMYCVFVYGYTHNHVFKQVEKILEKHIGEYHLVEAEIVLRAFQRSGKVFKSDTVIKQLWSLFFCSFASLEPRSTPETCEPPKMSYHFLRQMTKYISYLNSVEQLEAIGNNGCSEENVENLITVINCLSSAKFLHANFVSHVIEKIEDLTRRGTVIRTKSLANLCEFVANFGLDESETYNNCFDNLSTLLEKSSDDAPMTRKNYEWLKVPKSGVIQSDGIKTTNMHTLKFAVGMMIAGKFPFAIINDSFSASVCVNKETVVFFSEHLHLLQTCIDIEYPDYRGHEQMRSMLEEISPNNIHSDIDHFDRKNHLQNLVWASITNIVDENLLHYHKLLPYANKVIEIRLDAKNRPTSFDPVPYHKLPSTFKQSHIGIVILIHNKRQTTFNGGHPLGRLRLQKRHYEILGYKIVEVPVLSVQELQSGDAVKNMTDMLREKLEKCNVMLEEDITKVL